MPIINTIINILESTTKRIDYIRKLYSPPNGFRYEWMYSKHGIVGIVESRMNERYAYYTYRKEELNVVHINRTVGRHRCLIVSRTTVL